MTIKVAINGCGRTAHGRFNGTVSVVGDSTVVNQGAGLMRQRMGLLQPQARHHGGAGRNCITTGGGAFLNALEGKTLPGFEILQRRVLR